MRLTRPGAILRTPAEPISVARHSVLAGRRDAFQDGLPPHAGYDGLPAARRWGQGGRAVGDIRPYRLCGARAPVRDEDRH